jgi:sugar lactone lactonase YvrE
MFRTFLAPLRRVPHNGPLSFGQRPRLKPIKRHLPSAPARAVATRGLTPFPPHQLILIGGDGPEDIVADSSGRLLYGVTDGRILRFDPATGKEEHVGETNGRPLGLEMLADGRLLVCDARKGLVRIDLASGATEVLTDRVHDRPLRFCSNATAAQDGTIWFTESTDKFDIEHLEGAMLEHRGSGRLMRRAPDGQVDVVLEGLHFANGVTLDEDEESVIFAETDGYRLQRLWLKGPRQGKVEILADNLPGFPDNISRMRNGRFWVAMVTPRNRLLDRVGRSPAFMRELIWQAPSWLKPDPKRTVWAIAFDGRGRVVFDLQKTLRSFYGATGVVETNDRLYLVSIERRAILSLDLCAVCDCAEAHTQDAA